MSIVDCYVKLYGLLYNRMGIHYRLFSPIRYILRNLAQWRIPVHLASHSQRRKGCKVNNLVVSFTSFPARINKVWMVVESLKRQSFLPEVIILWLSKDQFSNEDFVPISLRLQEDDLFQIRIVDGDLKSHKKYCYAFSEFPDKVVVTVDDDIYYHPETIRFLIEGYNSHPNSIIANITARMTFSNGNIKPYKDWCAFVKKDECMDLVQKGFGGVLYPPHLLPPITTNKELFMELAPLADDLWLNAMARMNNVPIIQSASRILFLDIDNNTAPLSNFNVGQCQNDKQLTKIRKYLYDNFGKDLYKGN